MVTGGSKGIGAECSRMLARNGVRVGVVARAQEGIDAVLTELAEAGAEAAGSSADCTDAAEIGAAREHIEGELGPVDILLPFAGGFGAFTPIEELGEQEWRRVIDDNLTSTYLTVQAVLPGMLERERGAIVTMASNGGRYLDKLLTSSYAAAKAGVIQFTRHIALELGPRGIRANSIAPATVLSERVEEIMDEEAQRRVAEMSPLGRIGTTQDCALAVLFLVSDSASWLTGVTLDISGGRVML
ncbi:MAG: SDR family oxidoreductase [Solirubrobacterales bacterium]|nr:SDR family oxidoreductase [Solirubrobacterales bacterium]